MLGGKERTYMLTQVCVCDLLLSPGIKGLSEFKRIYPVQFPLKQSEPAVFKLFQKKSHELMRLNALLLLKEQSCKLYNNL